MKRYEEYKDSGVEWIGQVPSHWEVKRLKYLFSHSSAGVWGEDAKDDANDIVCFRVADFDYQHGCLSKEKMTIRNIQSQQLAGRELHKGDLLIEKSGGGETTPVGRVVRYTFDDRATCSNFIHFVTPDANVNSNYIYFYFYSLYSKGINLLFFNQTTGIQNLKISEYLSQTLFLPPLSEQRVIASYLDKKCGEIDKIISVQQQRIALLEELKQSIITQAVTKGLDKNAKMKESGVEWIGQVPEHWEIVPLKRFGRMNKGLTFTKADITDEGNPAISYGQIHSKENTGTQIENSLIRYVPDGFIRDAQKSIAFKGDFIFADTSEDYDGCGNCVYNDTDEPIYGGYHTIVLQSQHKEAKYLAYLFRTDCWRYQIRSRVYGVKVYSITQSILSLCSIILPPLSEQQSIASYLDKKCASIDASIQKANHEVELLQEYKQSLITEVVTGKRKVC